MIVIGIDPGISGALAQIDHHGLRSVADMPSMLRSAGFVKNQVDPAALDSLLGDWTAHLEKNEVMVMIERAGAMPKQGASSIFSIGLTMGLIEGIVVARRLPHVFVPPQEWKRAVGLPRVKGDKDAGKRAARTLAQRHYPDAELHLVKHHNRAEAILIARYGHERYA